MSKRLRRGRRRAGPDALWLELLFAVGVLVLAALVPRRDEEVAGEDPQEPVEPATSATATSLRHPRTRIVAGCLAMAIGAALLPSVLPDRAEATTTLIRASVNTAGEQQNGAVEGDTSAQNGAAGRSRWGPGISASGRFVAFVSDASNLDAAAGSCTPEVILSAVGVKHLLKILGQATPTCRSQVYVRDLQSNKTRLISRSASGGYGNGHSTGQPSISADGRFIAFSSRSTNLAAPDDPAVPRTYDVVYVVDQDADEDGTFGEDNSDFRTTKIPGRVTDPFGATTVVNPDRASINPSISADGRSVAFQSLATNFDSEEQSVGAGGDNSAWDIFVFGLAAGGGGSVVRLTKGEGGSVRADSYEPSMSADGRFVVFATEDRHRSTSFGPPASDADNVPDVHLVDRGPGRDVVYPTPYEHVSADSGPPGGALVGPSDQPWISGNGNRVAFRHAVTTIGGLSHDSAVTSFYILVRDRAAAATTLASRSPEGSPAQPSLRTSSPAISPDGLKVSFASDATNLVPSDTGGHIDIFVALVDSPTVQRASETPEGHGGNSPSDSSSALSTDGTLVTFASRASNLVAGDSNGKQDAFVAGLAFGTPGTPPVITMPAATLAPPSADFGDVEVTTDSAPQVFTLTSTGDAPLTISGVAIRGANAADFRITADNCTGATLTPSQACTVTLVATPSVVSAREATLAVTHNAGESTSSLIVRGTDPILEISPDPADFANQGVHTESGVRTITMTNRGRGRHTFGTIQVLGAHAGEFPLLTDTCSGQPLAPGLSCTVATRFRPEEIGPRGADLSVPFGPRPKFFGSRVRGNGVGPLGLLVPEPVDFGAVDLDASATEPVRLRNEGDGVLRVNAVGIAGADAAAFTLLSDGCSGRNLRRGEACELQVRFEPAAVGLFGATVVATHNRTTPTDRTTTIGQLVGEGTDPELLIEPLPLDFGEVGIGLPPENRRVRLTNLGRGTHSFGPILVGGFIPADYAITANSCATPLPSRATCELTVRFIPQAEGARLARIGGTFGPRSIPFFIDLLGTGAPARPRIDPTPVDFGNVVVEEAATQRVTVTNDGLGILRVGAASLSLVGSRDFRIVSDRCAGRALFRGQQCEVELSFRPSDIGRRSRGLTIVRAGRVPVFGVGVRPTPPPTTFTPSGSPTGGTPDGQTLVGVPTVELRPNVGSPGSITFVRGRGFPPDSVVVLEWTPDRQRGFVAPARSVRTNSIGEFGDTPILVMKHEVLGPRTMQGRAGELQANASFLVVPSTMRPSSRGATALGRTQLVTRG